MNVIVLRSGASADRTPPGMDTDESFSSFFFFFFLYKSIPRLRGHLRTSCASEKALHESDEAEDPERASNWYTKYHESGYAHGC